VAHPTFSVNGKLRYEHLEKLILLFDVFEGINGSCAALRNEVWTESLRHLRPEHLEALQRKHRIEPASPDPWRKGFIGGSDDHAGLFIGRTWTDSPALDAAGFLRSIRERDTQAGGRHNDFHTLAFSFYKVGYEFAREKGLRLPLPLLQHLNGLLFERRSVSVFERAAVGSLKAWLRRRNQRLQEGLLVGLEATFSDATLELEEKLDRAYAALARFTDDYFRSIFQSVSRDFRSLDLLAALGKISSSLLGVLLVLPFLSTLRHLFQDRQLLQELETNFLPQRRRRPKRVAWFSDTIADLNGVSVTLRKVGWLSAQRGEQLTLLSCLLDGERSDDLPPNLEVLPHIYAFSPAVYRFYSVKIPSVLGSLKRIYELQPEQIIVSTPGPVGLLGMLAGKLLAVPTKVIYHSDFTKEIGSLLESEQGMEIVESYVRWFHNLADEILVPTREYIGLLRQRGFDSAKLKLFRRGLDLQQYRHQPQGRSWLNERLGLGEVPRLLYVGRVSKDKNLDLLRRTYEALAGRWPGLALIVAGDGPYLEQYRQGFTPGASVHFLGTVSQQDLPQVYSAADLFLFPSTTDTFGMAVLEAQACGLPAVVSNVGGPQDIVVDGQTGLVAQADDLEDWTQKADGLLRLLKENRAQYEAMRAGARSMVESRYDWATLLGALFARPEPQPAESDTRVAS
jgi:glycosyltransferase involved in cell wall biosynthesis